MPHMDIKSTVAVNAILFITFRNWGCLLNQYSKIEMKKE
ncbi:hypothetical protein FCR2A7T_21990 [Flavobacterium cauense R2A-7]|nr:hypothetical protein FCR2A7T_21990 [Flavobacterium cauense R2A-7]